MPRKQNNSDAMALTIAEARAALGGISNVTIYSLINSGELRTFTIGRRRFVSREAIADFIRAREARSVTPASSPCPSLSRETEAPCGSDRRSSLAAAARSAAV